VQCCGRPRPRPLFRKNLISNCCGLQVRLLNLTRFLTTRFKSFEPPLAPNLVG
jgi:hypothetical protein